MVIWNYSQNLIEKMISLKPVSHLVLYFLQHWKEAVTIFKNMFKCLSRLFFLLNVDNYICSVSM